MNTASPPLLVADLGGTNARLGIAHWDERQRRITVEEIQVYRCSDFADPTTLFRAYLRQRTLPLQALRHACIAIAGPLRGNSGHFTNSNWAIDGDMLAAQLDLHRVQLLNDFAALASGVPFLADDELTAVRGVPRNTGPLAVMGAGTGFGAALLVPDGEHWQLIPTESGHASFAPASAQEAIVWEFLGGGRRHVCVEDVLSGTGIENIYRALLQTADNGLSADAIGQRALDDSACAAAIAIFCGALGSIAGNIALTQGARGGVYLGGGILPKIQPLFLRSEFLARFDDKGVMASYVEEIPIALIRSEYCALTGAAAWFWRHSL